jgi:phosphatidylinositol glycan class V
MLRNTADRRNVGPFHYWVPEQIPSFVLAAPVLWVSVLGCAAYFRKRCGEMSDKLAGGVGAQQVLDAVGDLLAQPAFPIYVYQAVMLVLLVFASHTQIALRLSLTDPVLWWSLAGMFLDASGTGKGQDRKGPRWWVWWCLVWGGVSLVLWAGHYPPA